LYLPRSEAEDYGVACTSDTLLPALPHHSPAPRVNHRAGGSGIGHFRRETLRVRSAAPYGAGQPRSGGVWYSEREVGPSGAVLGKGLGYR